MSFSFIHIFRCTHIQKQSLNENSLFTKGQFSDKNEIFINSPVVKKPDCSQYQIYGTKTDFIQLQNCLIYCVHFSTRITDAHLFHHGLMVSYNGHHMEFLYLMVSRHGHHMEILYFLVHAEKTYRLFR